MIDTQTGHVLIMFDSHIHICMSNTIVITRTGIKENTKMTCIISMEHDGRGVRGGL